MRIDWLHVQEWKNLRDFTMDLDETQLTSVLIGANATGKSNLIEAIVRIFRNLDLGEKPDFAYRIRYEVRGHQVEIDAVPRLLFEDTKSRKEIEITVDGIKQTQKDFESRKDELLPSNVFAYYSGTKRRLEALFDKHLENFYKATLDSEAMPLRRLFFCHSVHSNYVLMAYFAKGDSVARKFLIDQMGIKGIESVLFVLRNPWWFKGKPNSKMQNEGDPRFWFARGLVKKFVARLWDHAYPPIRDDGKEQLDFRGRSEDKQWLYLFVPDEAALQKLAVAYDSQKEFFKELETTWINDLIAETRIKVRRQETKNHVTFQDLSEGEQQLLTVLGLLKFTKDDESLFLLDEPDTHLNPQWKFDYLQTLEEVVGPHSKSQMLIATHDPLVIGGLTKNQVRVFLREKNRIQCIEPDEDPRGMGFAGLLKSPLFGLRSTVDPNTMSLLDKRAALYAMGKQRSPAQEHEMKELSDKLAQLGFIREFRDPYFEQFSKAMAKRKEFQKPILSPSEMEAQSKVANEILDEILAGEAK
jgi:predicted ATPase